MEWEFEIWQGGVMVVCGGGADRDAVEREAFHYLRQYSQDGPVQLRMGAAPLPDPQKERARRRD